MYTRVLKQHFCACSARVPRQRVRSCEICKAHQCAQAHRQRLDTISVCTARKHCVQLFLPRVWLIRPVRSLPSCLPCTSTLTMSRNFNSDGSGRPCSPRGEHAIRGHQQGYSIFGWADEKSSLKDAQTETQRQQAGQAARPVSPGRSRVAGIKTKTNIPDTGSSRRPCAPWTSSRDCSHVALCDQAVA